MMISTAFEFVFLTRFYKDFEQILTSQSFSAHFTLRKTDKKNIMACALNMPNCKCVNRKMNNPDIWMLFVYFAKKKNDLLLILQC